MFKIINSMPEVVKTALNKCRTLCGKKKIITLCTVSAILASIALLAANYRVGYTVKVNNTVVGTVATKGEYYEVLDQIKTEVSNISEIEFEPAAEEEFKMEIVSAGEFTDKTELAENLKSITEGMTEGYTITSDGEFVAALLTQDEANGLIAAYMEHYKGIYPDTEISLGTEVVITKGYVPEDTISAYDTILEELIKGKFVIHTVTVEDTIELISEVYGVSAEEILEVNAIEEIAEGMTLRIYTGEPVIPVKTVEYINGNMEIPFEIEEKEDATVYQGQTRIKTKGKVGVKYLHAYITKVNGVITEENIIESNIISEPVTQVVLIGTKELPPSAGTGDFIMPTSGTLSSPYGSRWGRTHQGIDVAAPTGTAIYASDNGIVIESEYRNNGYGNIIKIDHQNGYVTYYAHCSELYVSVGDVVAKGDKIAAVGSTGRSTGPHLHFEIRKDDVAQNPYNYID